MNQEAVNVLVVDDHRLMREGLCVLLDEHACNVVGQAESGEQAVALASELKPDIVLMDVSMPPGMNGVEATRQILADCDTKVIGLFMMDDRQFVSEMLTAGASGYLLKDCASDELALAITAVADGKCYLGVEVTGTVVEDYVKQQKENKCSVIEELTGRQREILRLLAEGVSPQDIAEALDLSVKTIHNHRDRIMDKLKTRSLADLTKIAVREGLTTL